MSGNLKRQAPQPNSLEASTDRKRVKKPGTQSIKSEVQCADPADQAATLKPYAYRTLETPNTIRVLCLEPAETESDPLRGSLFHFDRYDELVKLDYRQEYIAVSYAWGESEFSERLMLKGAGDDHYRSLTITSVVKVMLEHFRKRHKRIFLWIDAICLNQNDKAEKARQVPLMGEIYKQAYKSYFWVGLEDGLEAAKIFAYFRFLAVTNFTQSATNKIKYDHPDADCMKQIHQFFNRSWFFRRWVLQEMGLSRHRLIWCGHHKVQYELFVMACRKLTNTERSDEAELFQKTFAIETTVEIDNLMHSSTASRTIYSLLWTFHQSRCSEEKDRIGALYGLISSSMRPNLDLTASYQQIYESLAVELVRSSPKRLIYHLAHFRPLCSTKGIQAPTWIPDWSQERLQPALPVYEGYGPSNNDSNKYYRWRGQTETFADYRDDQATWLDFLGSMKRLCQHTRFTAYYGNNGGVTDIRHLGSSRYNRSAVLRVQWYHRLVGAYGIPIYSVIAIPTAPEGNGVPIAFVQDLRLIVKNLRAQDHTDRFCTFIASTIFADTSYHDSLLECFNNLIGEELAPCTHNSGQFDTQYLPAGHILRALARSMFRNQLAIFGWHLEGNDCSYGVGPSTLQRGGILIPLASMMYEGFSEGHFIDRRSNGLHENLMGVRVIFRSQSEEPKTHQTNFQNIDDVASDNHSTRSKMAPLQATYLGLCVCYRPDETTSRTEFLAKRRHVAYMREENKLAEIEGRPPPYVIDIV